VEHRGPERRERGLRGVGVVDADVEVSLLRLHRIGPGGRHMVLRPLEGEVTGAVGEPEDHRVVALLGDLHAEDLGVEGRDGVGVAAVEHGLLEASDNSASMPGSEADLHDHGPDCTITGRVAPGADELAVATPSKGGPAPSTRRTRMAPRLNPYLGFRDDARQAMEFYRAVFGGELTSNTFADFQASDDPADADKIMHSMLETPSGFVLMGADTPSTMEFRPGTNHAVSLSGEAADDAELRGYWDRLADGGTVLEPLSVAPWGDAFGMCTDRYGITWFVNIAGAPAQAGG